MKKQKISPQRLDKYIASKDWRLSRDFLLTMYDRMTPAQRNEIKEMFKRNSKIDK